MLPALFARASDAFARGPALRAHAVLRLRRSALGLRGVVMSAPDDVMGAALVLVRAAQTPAQQVEYFSQRNCELLGLTKRAFLELLRRPDAPSSLRLGKSRLVRRDAMLAFLEKLATKTVTRGTGGDADGADAVLREIGCAPVRRGRS